MSSLLTAGNALSDEGVAALLVDMAMLGVTGSFPPTRPGPHSNETVKILHKSWSPATLRQPPALRRPLPGPRAVVITPLELRTALAHRYSLVLLVGGPFGLFTTGKTLAFTETGQFLWIIYVAPLFIMPSLRLLANPQISGFSGAIHEKFPSEAAANAAYRFALSRGLVRGTNTPVTTPPPPYSAISDELDATATARAISPGVAVLKFYVVNPGRRPGIYASLYAIPLLSCIPSNSWYSVEATMAVVGVPGGQWSMHRSFRAACLAWARVVASNSIDIRPGE